jgi:hypothetical protein
LIIVGFAILIIDMPKEALYFLIFFAILTSCKSTSNNPNSNKQKSDSNLTRDTNIINSYKYKEEQDYLRRKRILCDKLALYDLERQTDGLELRVWYIPSMWDPSILYILKVEDSKWTLFHYQIYMHTSTSEDHQFGDPVTEYFKNPVVDSVTMENVRPQKIDWTTYIKNLEVDSLWNLETESSIKGKTFAVLDGHRYLLEINQEGNYKYLFYTLPEYFQNKESNHRKFIEFKSRLVEPIIYKGMRNP